MRICYVDESGDTGELPDAASPVQPLFCIAGLVFSAADLRAITTDFVNLKAKFFPHHPVPGSGRLGRILLEVKGADVRKSFRDGGRKRKRHHIGFLDHLLTIVERYQGRVYGKVFVKEIGATQDGTAIYTSAFQKLCADFEHHLDIAGDTGIILADSRRKTQNERVSFSIFTQKFQALGDPYPAILEVPFFGHSNNHAGLQIADLLVSALLFPIAAVTYCSGHIQSVHVHPGYTVLRERYGPRLKSLQYRYQDPGTQAWRGGIVVSDPLGHRSAAEMFRP